MYKKITLECCQAAIEVVSTERGYNVRKCPACGGFAVFLCKGWRFIGLYENRAKGVAFAEKAIREHKGG